MRSSALVWIGIVLFPMSAMAELDYEGGKDYGKARLWVPFNESGGDCCRLTAFYQEAKVLCEDWSVEEFRKGCYAGTAETYQNLKERQCFPGSEECRERGMWAARMGAGGVCNNNVSPPQHTYLPKCIDAAIMKCEEYADDAINEMITDRRCFENPGQTELYTWPVGHFSPLANHARSNCSSYVWPLLGCEDWDPNCGQ